MAEHNEQGTGKHPHKSPEEPFPHHEGKSQDGRHSKETGASTEKSETRYSSEHNGESDSSDLKLREYRDAEGNVHHHTHSYEEQHGSKK